MRFKGKVAIVTGGSGGIGKATAELLAREGARVMVADLTPHGAQVVDSMVADGLEVLYFQVDVSQEVQVADLITTTLEKWGRLDIMVANAGIAGRGATNETTLEEWQQVIDVNLTGVFLCSKHAFSAMKTSGGAIVNIASIMGVVGTRGASSYTASKGAVVNLTRSTALDYAGDKVRVNAVCPGHLDAPVAMGGAIARTHNQDDLLARYPLGRLGRPEDVAHAIAFLASDHASFITGTTLLVDGGYTAQ